MSENPYEAPKELGAARPSKIVFSIWWCIPLAFGGMVLGISFLAPYFAVAHTNGDGGTSTGGIIGGFAGLTIGLGLRILFPPDPRSNRLDQSCSA
jgi:hypothetical protein